MFDAVVDISKAAFWKNTYISAFSEIIVFSYGLHTIC